GSWLELSRHPASNLDACLEFRVDLLNNGSIFTFNSSHSSSNSSLYQNVNEPNVNVSLVANATTGYQVKFDANNSVFIKFLQLSTDSTYLVGCGFTNATDPATGYGFILGRSSYTSAGLKEANNNASLKYNDFVADNYTTILQTGCTRSSASQTLPLISGFLAMALLLIKA
ncbi:hypothetical protein KR044_009988, partial [Drosophila immigrans]